ncbi:ankyrin repeat domain-containing protein, partial [archaeon]
QGNDKVDVNAITSTRMTALHYAAIHNDRAIVTLLLQDTSIQRTVLNYKQHSAYDLCVSKGYTLLGNMIRYDYNKISICLAVQHHDFVVLEALYHQILDINTIKLHYHPQTNVLLQELYCSLLAAVAYNYLDMCIYILKCPEVNVHVTSPSGYTALHYACYHHNENMILTLLAAGVNRYHVDHDGHVARDYLANPYTLSVYNYASIHTDPPAKANPDSLFILMSVDPKKTYIHEYIYNKDYKATVAMLKQGVDVNHARYTLAINSPMIGSIPIYMDAQPPAPSHTTSPNTAARKRRSSAKQPPIPDLDTLFIEGETPLIAAAKVNALDIIKLLLKAPDILVDKADQLGWTPLFYAAYYGHEEAVLLLLKAKAARYHMNFNNQTAIDIANMLGYSKISAIIESDPYVVHMHDVCYDGK